MEQATQQLQLEQHHNEGAIVRVVVNRDGDTLPGEVITWISADDRDYRVNVRGIGPAAGKEWRACAPECVLPGAKFTVEGDGPYTLRAMVDANPDEANLIEWMWGATAGSSFLGINRVECVQ